MEITYNHPRQGAISGLLVGIDFDEELLRFTPIGEGYDKADYEVNLKYIELPRPKPRLVHAKAAE